MNHAAFELCRPSEGLLKAFRRLSGVEITPFSFFFGHPRAHARISSRLTGTCAEMAGQEKCSDSQYPSIGNDLWHQTVSAGFRTVTLVSILNLGSRYTLSTKLALNRAMKVSEVPIKGLKICITRDMTKQSLE
jgi:hypothetical protein